MTDSLQEMRYLPGRRVAHIVRPVLRGGTYPALVSYCGLAHHAMGWYGTSSPDEVARVAALPICKSCKKAEK